MESKTRINRHSKYVNYSYKFFRESFATFGLKIGLFEMTFINLGSTAKNATNQSSAAILKKNHLFQ